MMNNVNIGGIDISAYQSIDDLIDTSILTPQGVKPGVAVAINPEKIMTAKADENVMRILQKATLRYADGIGVSYVMSKRLSSKVARIPGCELWERLMTRSTESNVPVFLLGAKEHTVLATRNKLLQQGVNIVGYRNGYFTDQEQQQVIAEIAASGAQLVSAALGSPRQELFIFECMKTCPNSFFMGVGGTYDVFTNTVKRAPYLFRALHLEWLFRLLGQPSRILRQTSLLKYVYYYFANKL